MSINSHLTRLANKAIVRDSERESINRSLSTLRTRLNAYFGTGINKQLVFGSFSRGTILPRAMDTRSDVDYMVVFSDTSFKPQTYLNQLRTFVEKYYGRSEITQSNPTIVLTLNHIRFELVPAIDSIWTGLQIPAKASDYQDWIDTDPTGFNQTLTTANQSNNNFIKPLVRLVKYWNACNNYPFESYELEQKVVNHGFWLLNLLGTAQLKEYFYSFMEELEVGFFAPQWKQEALKKTKGIIQEAKVQERNGYPATAESTIVRLLPTITALV